MPQPHSFASQSRTMLASTPQTRNGFGDLSAGQIKMTQTDATKETAQRPVIPDLCQVMKKYVKFGVTLQKIVDLYLYYT